LLLKNCLKKECASSIYPKGISLTSPLGVK